MMSADGRAHWLPDTSVPVLSTSVGQVLREAAIDVPDKEALISVAPDRPTRTWTYAELLADAERTAAWLSERFQPGEHIAVWAPNVPEWVLLQYGAAIAGLVLVTVNPALRGPELEHALESSHSVGFFYVGSFRGTDMTAIASEVLPAVPRVREPFRLETLMHAIADHPAGGDFPVIDPASPAQIQFTSGTTGRPKPAVLTHAAMVTNAAHVRDRCGVAPAATYGTALPLFHTAGCGLAGIGSFYHRATWVLAELFDPETVLRSIEEHTVVAFGGVPAMLHALLAFREKTGADTSSIDVLMSGGDAVPPALINAWRATGVRGISAVYGQTELSPIVCQTAPSDALDDVLHTAGLPLPQTEVAIVDPVSERVVEPGEEGEIRVRGYLVMQEYFGMPEATAHTIDEEGWLRTGDLGNIDARGYVTVTGRLKDMIIRGGENLYPREIEDALAEHPSIAQAAVVGVDDEQWGETVAAVLTLADSAEAVDPAALRSWVRERLAPQKTPVDWFVADSLPTNAMGKLQKFRLREQIAAGGLRRL
jgi:fatty-acyl-CoA synthase/long-chain acyl-CoA synthetase